MRNQSPTSAVEMSALARPRVVSLAFERLAGFIAIRQTQREDEVLRELLCHVAIAAQQALPAARAFAEILDTQYGLRVTELRIQTQLDRAVTAGELSKTVSGAYTVSLEKRAALLKRIEDARALEVRVREQWIAASKETSPSIDPAQAWRALEAYLTRAFRQHGIQTIALIDPSLEVPEEHQASLRAMLRDALDSVCEPTQRPMVEHAISDFLLNASRNADRSAFIARLADCTVSYYSLTVPPDVAQHLKTNLHPLVVFLDTNVLFGLIGLDDGPLADVSSELTSLVVSERLPLRLKYHSSTAEELRRTFDTIVAHLKGSTWSPSISRGAAKSSRVSTIQRIYHERNAEQPISPESFFKPFEHMDVLLADKGVGLYRDAAATDKQPVYDLMADYTEFLKEHHREKPYEAIEHDMALLHRVRTLRSKATSSLEAEAVCVTTDFLLWKFDRKQSRRANILPTMLLPTQMLQLLRPFVAITPDFDRSFADSFAVPEFRAMGDGSNAAATRMLEIVAAYGEISSDTVSALLANDLFLDGLAGKKEADARDYVESAIAAQNEVLAKEREELRQELEARTTEVERQRAEHAEQLESERQRLANESAAEIARRDEELARVKAESEDRLERTIREKEELAANERSLIEIQRREAIEAEAKLRSAAEDRARRAEAQAAELIDAKDRAATAARIQRENRVKLGIGIVVGLLIAAAGEATFRLVPFTWLLNHPNGYGLRGCFALIVMAISIAVFRRDWAKTCLIVAVFPGILIILQIVGGATTSPSQSTGAPAAPRLPSQGNVVPPGVSIRPP